MSIFKICFRKTLTENYIGGLAQNTVYFIIMNRTHNDKLEDILKRINRFGL